MKHDTKVIAHGIVLASVLRDARNRLWNHHEILYHPELGKICSICLDDMSGNIFVKIDRSLADWESLFLNEIPNRGDGINKMKSNLERWLWYWRNYIPKDAANDITRIIEFGWREDLR